MKGKFELKIDSDKDLLNKEAPCERILSLGVIAPELEQRVERPALNLCLVIDRSGSMSGGKLEYARQAAAHAVQQLREGDQIAVVAFDNNVEVVSPSLPATAQNKHQVVSLIAGIREGGSTNLSGGWLTGCQLIAAQQREGQVARAILLTDGQANVGITDAAELARHARELNVRGISTSTFGIGDGFNEHLLEAMSNAGGGNFRYIATPEQIPALFAEEMGQLGMIVLRKASLEITVPFGYSFRVLGSYYNTVRGNVVTITLNDMYAGGTEGIFMTALVHNQPEVSSVGVSVVLRGLGENDEAVEVKAEKILTFASEIEEAAAPVNRVLLEAFVDVLLADLQAESLKMERRGLGREAAEKLRVLLERWGQYLPANRVLYYQNLIQRMQRNDLQEFERKALHQEQYTTKRTTIDRSFFDN